MEQDYSYQAKLYLSDVADKVRTEADLKDLKHAVSEFFAKRADRLLDKMWEDGTYDQKKLDELRGQHFRTPYGK